MNWEQLLQEQQSSGKSAREFCDERGISVDAFYNQRAKLKSRVAPPHFARVETSSGVTIELGNGMLLRVALSELKQVVELLR